MKTSTRARWHDAQVVHNALTSKIVYKIPFPSKSTAKKLTYRVSDVSSSFRLLFTEHFMLLYPRILFFHANRSIDSIAC
jgi:hypothetical protein